MATKRVKGVLFDIMSLPGEIRNMIWESLIPTDRVLSISLFIDQIVTIPPPTIAWLCRESRGVALQHGRPYAILGSRWTWFSPKFDRVLTVVSRLGDQWRSPMQQLGPLAMDARHILVQGRAFLGGYSTGERVLRLVNYIMCEVVSYFPNAQSIGVVHASFVIKAAGSDGGGGRRASIDFWDYTSLKAYMALTLDRPPISVLSDPEYIRTLEKAHAQLTALCSCSFQDTGEEGTHQHDSRNGGEHPHPRTHHHQHGLSGLWSAAAARPNHESVELWRAMQMWFRAQVIMSPMTELTAFEQKTIFFKQNLDEWHSKLRTWIVRIGASHAPHIYSAELTAFGNRRLGASSRPICTEGGESGCGRIQGEDLLNKI